MRIIDAHVHIGKGMFGGPDVTSEKMASDLEYCGVEKAVVFTLGGLFDYDCVGSNNEIKGLADQRPEMFIPFCTVNPHRGKAAVNELRRAVLKMGMRGLKLHGWCQAFSVMHPSLGEIVEEAANLRIPILFHDGSSPYCTSLQIGYLAERHPKATIILGHAGLYDYWKNAIDAAMRSENVVLCACGAPFIGVKRMVEEIGADRIVFGSDAGFCHRGMIEYGIKRILQLKISEGEKEKILGLNMARMLGI